MGDYVYTLKGPKHNIKVNINGVIESVALLTFHYKPISCWDGEPRWQTLARARCQRMDNIWQKCGFPKYACNVFVENDGTIKFSGSQIFEWPVPGGASICDGTRAYQMRKHIGYLKHKFHNIWEITP